MKWRFWKKDPLPRITIPSADELKVLIKDKEETRLQTAREILAYHFRDAKHPYTNIAYCGDYSQPYTYPENVLIDKLQTELDALGYQINVKERSVYISPTNEPRIIEYREVRMKE